MQKLRQLVILLPEIFLILLTCYWWTLTSTGINIVAIIVIVALIIQIIFKNRIMGLILSGFLALSCLLFLIVMIIDFNEFNITLDEDKKLYLFSAIYLGLNLAVSILMALKYFKNRIIHLD